MNIELIEQKRLEKNLTVTALCELAGIDRSTYYKAMEEPQNIRYSTVSKLVKALRLNAAEKAQIFN